MASNQQSTNPMRVLRALCHRYRNAVYPGHLPAKHCLNTSHTMCMWLSCHPCPALSCPGQAALSHDCCVALTAPGMMCTQQAHKRFKARKVPL